MTEIFNLQSEISASISVAIARFALLGRAAKLEKLTVWTPGVGFEAGAGKRQYVAVSAALWAVFGRTPPPTRLELDDGGGRFRRVDRRV